MDGREQRRKGPGSEWKEPPPAAHTPVFAVFGELLESTTPSALNVPREGPRGGGETFLIGAGSYYSSGVDM